MVDADNPIKSNISTISEYFCLEKEDILHPDDYEFITKYQQNNKSLKRPASFLGDSIS